LGFLTPPAFGHLPYQGGKISIKFSPLIGGAVLSNSVRLVGVVSISVVYNPTTTSWSPSPIREEKSTTGLSPLIGGVPAKRGGGYSSKFSIHFSLSCIFSSKK
jgi:hypothetical protein